MASTRPSEYLIFRPEKVGFLDILSLLFTRRRLTDYKFVESDSSSDHLRADIFVALALIVLKVLAIIRVPLKYAGIVTEFLLNLLSLNGGFFCLLWHIITLSVKIPRRDAVDFRSFIAYVDERRKLWKTKALMNYFPLMGDMLSDLNILDLSIMAAKIAYENPAYIQDVVSNTWKMHFVKFFDCWNKYQSETGTQAFVFSDKEEDASMICVAFRGTELFNAKDWSTDVDISTISMGAKRGNVHLGFVKALGLQDETNFAAGFPKDHPTGEKEGKPLAYYAIRAELLSLLAKHPNAQLLVTGHSLGAALACLFPVLLEYHGQTAILSRLHGVMTHAQPRVGDATFAGYMETALANKNYCRIVFRYDIVPRVPLDCPPISHFKHFGTCLYYKSWKKGKMVSKMPNHNYFSPLYVVPMYWNAWGDVVRGMFAGLTLGKDFREGWVSIAFRLIGLIVPGLASHSPRDYVNPVRLAAIATKDMV